MMETVLIAAVSENGVIGKSGDLPFKLRSDLQRFKALTLGHPVLMGRGTYESIGRPLPGRPNIVVSGDPDYHAEGCEMAPDLETAINRARMLAEGLGKQAFFVIGGGQVYAQTIAEADRLEITHVQSSVDGSQESLVHFPQIDPAVWTLAFEESRPAGEHDEADMIFATYVRNAP